MITSLIEKFEKSKMVTDELEAKLDARVEEISKILFELHGMEPFNYFYYICPQCEQGDYVVECEASFGDVFDSKLEILDSLGFTDEEGDFIFDSPEFYVRYLNMTDEEITKDVNAKILAAQKEAQLKLKKKQERKKALAKKKEALAKKKEAEKLLAEKAKQKLTKEELKALNLK